MHGHRVMTQFYVGTLNIRLGKLFRFDAEELRVIKSSYSIMYSHYQSGAFAEALG